MLPVSGEQPDVEPDECEHEYDEDEDTLEYVCVHCGDREPIPLDRLIRDS